MREFYYLPACHLITPPSSSPHSRSPLCDVNVDDAAALADVDVDDEDVVDDVDVEHGVGLVDDVDVERDVFDVDAGDDVVAEMMVI